MQHQIHAQNAQGAIFSKIRQLKTFHPLTNYYLRLHKQFGTALAVIAFLATASQTFATKYYVNVNGGSDANSTTAAQNPGSAWATVAFAISQAVNDDSLVVLPGTYSETNVVINKRLKLFGNETGGVVGSGAKPVFEGTSSTANGSVFIIQSTLVTIRNFEIRVNQVDVIRGIFCNGGGYNLLQILDNHIFSTNSSVPSIFNSYGIQLGTTSIQAGQDSFFIARNIIQPLGSGSATFGRGIRLVGGFGLIGGATLADSNHIVGDYGIQAGDIRRAFNALNNRIFGRSAGIELNIPAGSQTHVISENIFKPISGTDALALIEIKNNINTNSVIEISSNQFIGHQIFGIFSTRSLNVNVRRNTFIPVDTGRNYIHIAVNTKQQTTANDSPRPSGITILGNMFEGNAMGQGTAIAFQNHNGGSFVPFINTTIGGLAGNANTFGPTLGRYMMLDTAAGPSINIPLWNQTGYKTSQMKPVSQPFDLSENLFDLGSGASRPSAKTNAELIAIENRIIHGIDYDSLGFVTLKSQTAYVSTTSFFQPVSNAPSLHRAIRQAGNNDGWTVVIEPGTYPDKALVSTNLTLTSTGTNAPVTAPTLEMRGSGKTLNMDVDFYVSDSLKLTDGNIALGVEDIQVLNGAILGGGSASSFITSSGTGLLVYESLGATAVSFPLGTAQGYYPLSVSNSGSADAIGFRAVSDVLSNGLVGTPVDSVVNATWVVNEGTVGGSNLSIVAGWPGAGEKPFFTRSETVMQGFSGGAWSNVSNSPVVATGADPYSGTYSNITTGLASLPLRVRTVSAPAVASRLYYVDDNTGDDSRTNDEAKNPNTPWRTITNAVALTADGDSVQVFAGTYSEANITVNKKLTLLGNVIGVGSGVGAGTGVKPIVNGIAPVTLDSAIFIIRDSSVLIKNFNIKVDIDRIKIGVYGPFRGFAGLVIEDNLFESTSDIVSGGLDVVVLSHAILLGRITVPNGNGDDSVIVRRNLITREGPTKKWFSRGVRWFGCRGMIGGDNPADGNEVHADFAIQCGGGNFTGRLQTRNNNVFGRAAGIEYNTPPPSYIHTIANNTVQPLDNSGHFALIEIKSNIRTTVPTSPAPPFIDVENNNLIDFYNIGVAITRSRMTRVMNNTFTPRADSTRYMHVWVNSKQRTAGSAASQAPLSSVETLIQGNTFNSNNVFGGYGIAFQNANRHTSGKVFTINNMGGAGALANTFGANIAKVVYLDTITGPSSNDPFWSKPGVNWTAWPSTPTGPVEDNFDFSENLFDVGTGSKRPAAMTNAELLQLEDRVVHKIDADTLGFVTMKANNVFVTQQSFVAPLTTTPRLQRAVKAAGTVDGVTVNIETGTYNGQTTVAQSIIFDATPDGEVTSEDLGMNGAGKTLTLADDFKVSSTFRLTDGLVDLGSSDFTMVAGSTVTGGSLASHVQTNGTGYFINENVAGTLRSYPVGTGTRYAATQIRNTGTIDNIGLKVSNDVLANGLTGAVQDTVVDITYQIRETTSGGSGLVFEPTWTAANERPIFDRNQVYVEQHNGATWQNIGPNTPTIATGTDPFTASVAISGNWNDQPVRVIGRAAAATPTGNLYYVDDASGLDTRTNAEATNPNTPWKTMTKALASIANGDSVQVFAGTYAEANLAITKSVYLFGNVVNIGTGPGAGTGVKPVFNGTSGTPQGSIFILQADSVLIQNFEIQVNQLNVNKGIFSNGGGFNGVRILDNHIFSTFSGVPSIFNSYGIQLGTTSVSAGADSFLIARNVIRRQTAGSATFGRGIRTMGGFGMIGGPTASDSNYVEGDYGIQSGNPTRKFQVTNNHLFGQSAAVELNIPAQNQRHIINGNTINPVSGRNALTLIEIKNNTRANSVIEISNNQISGHQVMGIFSTRSRNVEVTGNTFMPSDTGRMYAHIVVNTKQQTTATEASVTNGISITGNTFLGSATNLGTGIAFQNHNSGAVPQFDNVVIGGTGAAANTFGAGMSIFFALDTASGPSTQNPLWNQTGIKTTLMRPVSANFNLNENLFDLGSGATLPSAKSITELFQLENRIIHGIDFDSLGFASVNPLSSYTTQQSFIAPVTTAPSLQRAINPVGTTDGWFVFAEGGAYPGKATVSTNLTLTSDGGANPIVTDVVAMNGAGKTLQVNHNLNITDSLNLLNGNIGITTAHITMESGAEATGGSATSFMQTDGLGMLRYSNQAATSNLYPLGTAQGYFPLQITNTGTADTLGIRVQNDVLDAGLTGNPVDSVVNATWVMNESVAGGSNLSVTASWTGANEKTGFDRTVAFMQGFDSGWNEISDGPVAATGADPYTATFVNINTALVNKPVRIGREVVESIGNLYYVDDDSGLDSRTNEEAKNPNTPWRTIANALARTADGDSIQVFEGTYNEANLRVTKALNIFGNVLNVGTGVGAGTGIRPIVNGSALASDSSIFTIQSPNVLINNFRMEVDQVLIVHGVLARTGVNYNNLRLIKNRILSTGVNPVPPFPCLRFNTYGIRLAGFGTDSITIQGNEIEPSALDGSSCVFGRGIKLFGGHGLIGGPNDLDSNRILAYYDIQAGDIDGGKLVIENNFTVGVGVQIVAPAANSGTHEVRNNRIFIAFPQQFPNLVELKDIQNPGTGVLVTGNNIVGYSNAGVFSQRCQNVSIVGNNFIPVDTARNFRHIVVNTKQETIGVDAPAPSSIIIQSNNFRGTTVEGRGTALEFGNHHDDPTSAQAFTGVIIGGPGALANNFAKTLGKFMVLDPLTGLSGTVPFWSSYPPTQMHPVADNFDIRDNLFGVDGGLKLPSAMTDDEHYEMEDKVSHGIDYDSLGFVTWKPEFAYVTDSSFLKPYSTTPSLQRAVKASGINDTWQVNIEPIEIQETVTVPNSIIWNTYPRDTMRLGGISMNGLNKTLTLTDRFVLTNALTLNNLNGGRIDVGNNDLVTLPTATVTAGTISSYVISNGTGGLVRRGVTDQSFDFPIGTIDSYAPVNFDDANNTGDNFKITVKPAATNADFTPPLPATITTHVKFEWRICEDVTGGSNAQLIFGWTDPANVNGSGILNGISRNDGTNWNSKAATVNPDLTARASDFTDFCSPFAVVADPLLTTITTFNPIKVLPGVAGSYCVGDTIKIPFTVDGSSIIAGNTFNAFLSNADGTFPVTGGVLIGSLLGFTSDTLIGVIPSSTLPGSNYHIRVVSTNSAVTGTANPDSIKIFGLPARPTITGDSAICQGETTTLTSSAAAGYVWKPNGEITDTINVTTAGTYFVTISDVNGCQNTSAPRNVSVLTTPVAEPITFTGTLTRCAGDSIVLTANPAGLNYLWLNTTPAVTTRDLTVKTSGTYQVVISNTAGCSDTSAAVNAVFNANPAQPTISLVSANDTVCQPTALEFTTIAGFSYDWSITGVTPNPTTQSVSFTLPGSYSGTVTITDGNGCKATSESVSGLVKKAPNAPTIAAIGGDLSICEGDSIQIQPSGFSSANTYTWTPGSVTGVPLVVKTPGTITVTVVVDSVGCSTAGSNSLVANVNARPVKPSVTLGAGQNASFCAGDSVTLTSSVNPTGYLWSPGNETSQFITVKTSGSYTVVTLSDSSCRSLPADPVAIDVKPLPAKPEIVASRTQFCQGQDATITITNAFAGNTYTWIPAGSGVGNAIVVTTAGNYAVRVDTTNGCFQVSDAVAITVNPLPQPIITATDDKFVVCQGETVILNSNYSEGNQWSTGQSTPLIVLSQSVPSVTLTVTDNLGCSASSLPVAVVVNPLPTVTLEKDTAVVFGEDVELIASNFPANVSSFSWLAAGTQFASGTASVQLIKPEQTATYMVVVEDVNGCRASDTVRVRVSREVYVPNMFSPNGDGNNDVFKVYGFGVASIEVQVWDRLGNLVYETTRVSDIVETEASDDSVPGWDGKYKGKELGQESFVWSVKGKLTTGEEIKVRGGNNSGSVIIMN